MPSLLLTGLLLVPALVAQQPLPERGIRVESRLGKVTPGMVPRGYALIIGVARYPNMGPENNKLRFPERDAESIHNILISQEGGNFAPENVRKLIGPQATLANIRRELEEWLPSVAREGDRVLVYFAGHAFLVGGKGYLAPSDAVLERLEATAYPMERLGQVLGTRIKSRWKVLLTDACHSAGTNDMLYDSMTTGAKTLMSLTASRRQESSYEDPQLGGGHGLFSYFVMKALEGQADVDGNGAVTADELIEYVRSNVREYARQRSAQQTPSDYGDFDNDLIVAFNPKLAAAAGSASTFASGQLVVESNRDGVEFLLDGKSMGTVNKDKPLSLPGISPGVHTVQGVKMGYDPDGPREILVYPGKETPVSLRIQFAKIRKKSAVDPFREGLKLYQKGSNQDCRAAIPRFQKALAEDPRYSEAALYLGRTYQVLFETEPALKYHQMAIELDPDYVEAHVSLGSMLLDMGNTDEAIRHLRYAAGKDPKNSQAHAHLAQAYRMTGTFDKAIEEAREALRMNPSNAQALLWLGDSLRAQKNFAEARDAYLEYIRISDFDAGVAEKVGFYLFSTPFTKAFSKKRATQKQVYMDQRNIGFFGLCECERRLGNPNRARQYCQKALSYDPEDVYTYYNLGRISLEQFNRSTNPETLVSAKSYFEKMLALNSDLEEAQQARQYVQAIDKTLQKLARK